MGQRDQQTIEQRVIEIVCNQTNSTPDDVTSDTKILQDLIADSLDMVELVMEFEDEFDISISDEEVARLITIEDIVKLIESKGRH